MFIIYTSTQKNVLILYDESLENSTKIGFIFKKKIFLDNAI